MCRAAILRQTIVRAVAAPRGDVEFIHQPVDRSQARAAAAGRRETVAEGLLDIGDAGAVSARFNLQADPRRRRPAASGSAVPPRCVLDQVGGQFRHGKRDFFAGGRDKAQAAARALAARLRRSHVALMADLECSAALAACLLPQPLADLHRGAFAHLRLEWSFRPSSRLAPGNPRPSPLPVLKPDFHRLGDIRNPRPAGPRRPVPARPVRPGSETASA